MSDPAILFVKPKAISQRDKKMLQQAGVLIVEIENPADAKFVRANAELSSTEMVRLAARVIHSASSTSVREAFAKAVCEALMAKPIVQD